MKNYVQPGQKVPVVATGNVASGQGVLVEKMFGVAEQSAAAGETYELMVQGVFDLPAAGALVANQGVVVYWDGSAVTTSTSGTTKIGFLVKQKLNGETTARVRLHGV
ncbi:MAG: DUF2190 family protein [Planctomycetota bacterium]